LESGVDVVAEAPESVVRRLKDNAVGGFANAVQSVGNAVPQGPG
jgi:hypothetical protein